MLAMIRSGLVLSLAASFVVLEGCMPRGLARAARNAQREAQRDVKPEDMRIPTGPLSAQDGAMLARERKAWGELVAKYQATELRGGEQFSAVFAAYAGDGGWMEKKKEDEAADPFGVALGDILQADGHVRWVTVDGIVCLVSANGKVAVDPYGLAAQWLASKSNGLTKAREEVAKAVRETTGEPVLIGFQEGE